MEFVFTENQFLLVKIISAIVFIGIIVGIYFLLKKIFKPVEKVD